MHHRASVTARAAPGEGPIARTVQPGVPRKGGMRDMPAPTLPFSPDLGFTQTFEEAGLYRMWVGLGRGGQDTTAPFTIEVI